MTFDGDMSVLFVRYEPSNTITYKIATDIDLRTIQISIPTVRGGCGKAVQAQWRNKWTRKWSLHRRRNQFAIKDDMRGVNLARFVGLRMRLRGATAAAALPFAVRAPHPVKAVRMKQVVKVGSITSEIIRLNPKQPSSSKTTIVVIPGAFSD